MASFVECEVEATTFDLYLNACAFVQHPRRLSYKLGGYQALKKRLSYRERDILGRALAPKVQHFAYTARIAAFSCQRRTGVETNRCRCLGS